MPCLIQALSRNRLEQRRNWPLNKVHVAVETRTGRQTIGWHGTLARSLNRSPPHRVLPQGARVVRKHYCRSTFGPISGTDVLLSELVGLTLTSDAATKPVAALST